MLFKLIKLITPFKRYSFSKFVWIFSCHMLQYLGPRLILKSATTFSRYKLPLLYDNVKAAFECIHVEKLPQCTGIAISTDIWRFRNNGPFQSMTLHYINKSWQLRQFVLNAQYFSGKQLKLTL